MATFLCSDCGTIPSACHTSVDIGTLFYVFGLDSNLCEKFEQLSDVLQLRDCASNPISISTPIVTCANFRTQMCAALNILTNVGSVNFGVTEIVGADCNKYTIPETPITVIDTNGINLTVTGTLLHTLQADVVISPTAGNVLALNANGLYVPSACTQITAFPANGAATALTQLVGADCKTYTVTPGTSSIVVAADTPCIDMTVVQAPAGTFTVSAVPIICPTVGNALSCSPCGLFVASPPVTNLTSVDTNCINTTITQGPVGSFNISSDPIISGAFGNTLTCTPLGLYAACCAQTPITPIDTNSINLTVSGVDNHTLQADVKISATAGNQITVLGDGLFVAADVDNTFVGVDTNCIDTTVSTVGTVTSISSVPIIANTYPGFPANCNPLLCTATGLAIPPEHSSACNETARGILFQLQAPYPVGSTTTGPLHTLIITNTSTCRSARVTLKLYQPLFQSDNQDDGQYQLAQIVSQQFNFPTVPLVTALTPINAAALWGITDITYKSEMLSPRSDMTTATFILAPGASGSYSAQVVYGASFGNAGIVTLEDTAVSYCWETI